MILQKRRWWFSTPTDTVTKRKKRRWWFSLSTETVSRWTLLEHENAPLSLDRLYRLHQGYLQAQPPVTLAGFIHNGKPLSALELEALQWARGEEPLEVLALEEVFSILQAHLSH